MRLSRLNTKSFIPTCLTQRRHRLSFEFGFENDEYCGRSWNDEASDEKSSCVNGFDRYTLHWKSVIFLLAVSVHFVSFLFFSFELKAKSPYRQVTLFIRLSYSKVTLLLLWDIFTLSNVFFFSQRISNYRYTEKLHIISSLCPTEQSHDTVDICHNEAAVIIRYFSLWTYMNTHFSYTINWFKVDASKSDKCVCVCVYMYVWCMYAYGISAVCIYNRGELYQKTK